MHLVWWNKVGVVRYFVAGLMSQKMSKFLLYLACNLEIKIRGTSLCLEYAFFCCCDEFWQIFFCNLSGKNGSSNGRTQFGKGKLWNVRYVVGLGRRVKTCLPYFPLAHRAETLYEKKILNPQDIINILTFFGISSQQNNNESGLTQLTKQDVLYAMNVIFFWCYSI